jgi:hypothetical protein
MIEVWEVVMVATLAISTIVRDLISLRRCRLRLEDLTRLAGHRTTTMNIIDRDRDGATTKIIVRNVSVPAIEPTSDLTNDSAR